MSESNASQPSKKTCGVLGCTGSVGQRFMLLLAAHPNFTLHVVGASARSAGKRYKDAVAWKQSTAMPKIYEDMIVKECVPGEFAECDLVFSGLDADVAGEIETAFVQANLPVFSNAKNHRHDPNVPLIVPTINLSHMELLPHQQKLHGISKGFLICNSNCSLVGIAVPFAALQNAFGPIECASVVTMQAISGGGYPGVSSMEILDNVVPYIDGEEEKIQVEARKVLGSIDFETMTVAEQSQLRISAACNRVAVMDGHLACVSLRFERKPPNMKSVKEALATYISRAQTLGCPSAPSNAIVLMEELDRPQPRLDRDMQNGFTVSVGRLREDESGIFDLKFVSLSHNTILGAAGASILNAEAAMLQNLL